MDDGVELPQGAFDGRVTFAAHVRLVLGAAAREGWREIVLADPDFSDWPLGERQTIEALQAWAANGRRLVMLAQRFTVFEREHARFVRWRQLWSHIVEARVCRGLGVPDVPSVIWTPSWYMHRIDPEHCRGVCQSDKASLRAVRETIDECLRHGQSGFPSSTLGL